MKTFIAKNAKQLDICLRLLHSQSMQFKVEIKENEKKKIIYTIQIEESEDKEQELEEKYELLIL